MSAYHKKLRLKKKWTILLEYSNEECSNKKIGAYLKSKHTKLTLKICLEKMLVCSFVSVYLK